MRTIASLESNPARALLIFLWGGLCCLIVAAPLLSVPSPSLSALIYLFFAPICHQRPERCFFVFGRAFAVCQRCTGIYGGLFLGSLIPFHGRLFADPLKRRKWVLGAVAPLLFDVFLPNLGIWQSNAASRLATGMIFGTMLAALVLSGVEELLAGASPKKLHFRDPQLKGDIS